MTINITNNSEVSTRTGKFGTGPDHQQQPLMAMVEITNRCNMRCPVCFTNAKQTARDVPYERVQQRLDTLLRTAGPIPLQISGGEPTLHKDLAKIISYAKKSGFRNIDLVTNGIRIANNHEYLFSLVEAGLTAVYLQFDGLEKRTYLEIRGQDMTEVRERSVAAIHAADICCTLAVAVTRGVNDHELGNIVRFGVDNIDTVRAINFQAAARFAGRFMVSDHQRGFSLAELVTTIEQQSVLAHGGFLNHLLGHPQCNAMSLVYVIDGKLEPLFNHISPKTLESFLGEKKREIISDLFMGKERFAKKYILNPKTWKVLMEAAAIYGKSKNLKSILQANHILLFAKSFMEQESLNLNRLDQCCYGIAVEEGVYSFCAYNNLHRFNKVRKT